MLTQRFSIQLYRLKALRPACVRSKWADADMEAHGRVDAAADSAFEWRTCVLRCEKTGRPTRLSGHCRPRDFQAGPAAPVAAVTMSPRTEARSRRLPVAQRIVHPPPKRAIQVRVLTGGPAFANPSEMHVNCLHSLVLHRETGPILCRSTRARVAPGVLPSLMAVTCWTRGWKTCRN